MSGPASADEHRALIPALTDGQLEGLKWLAFGAMLLDHFGRYAFGMPEQSWVFSASRVTFPIFAFVLAINLARPGDRESRAFRVSRRLALWAGFSVLPSYWARDEMLPINVLATLSLGALLTGILATPARTRRSKAIASLAMLAGVLVEFSLPGVWIVPALSEYCRNGSRSSVAQFTIAFALLMGLNLAIGGPWALCGTVAAPPLLWIVSRIRINLIRRKWLFYVAYPSHLLAVSITGAAML